MVTEDVQYCCITFFSNKQLFLWYLSPGAGHGDISVVIVDPQGKKDTVELMLENKGDSVFRCTYRPVQEGPHAIHVLFAGQEIPRSPFTVNIAEGKSFVWLVNNCLANRISRRAVSVEVLYPSQATAICRFAEEQPRFTLHNPLPVCHF